MSQWLVRSARWVGGFYPLLLVIAGWEIVARAGLVRSVFLPSFSDVMAQGWHLMRGGELWMPLIVSLYRALAGLALALIGGTIIGFMMARWRLVARVLDPLVSFGYPAPKLAFIPIFILWFGIDHLSKILLVAVSCIFPVIISAYSGAQTVPLRQIWAARAMGTSQARLFHKIVLPAALPALMSGIRVAVPLALLTAFTAEMVAGGGGVGGALVLAQRYFEAPTVFVYILVMLISGYVIDGIYLRLRAWMLRWDDSEAVTD